MSIRSISINQNDLMVKPKKERKSKKKNTNSSLSEPVTINSTNIRKLLLEKLKQHKKTQKNILLNKDQFDSKIPSYSNLKNGSKPTYRELHKMNSSPSSPSLTPSVMPSVTPSVTPSVMPSVTPSVPIMNTYSTTFPVTPITSMESVSTINARSTPHIILCDEDKLDEFDLPSKKQYIQAREIKKTFHLGKNKKNNSINVLIKCNKTRKNVEHTKSELKKTKLNTIKNYLKTNNLVKFGTTAPSGLLKEIYESSKLCGEVYNNNSNTLLHNYNINNNS